MDYFKELVKNFREFKPLPKLLAIFTSIAFILQIITLAFSKTNQVKDVVFLLLLIIIIMILVRRHTQLKYKVNKLQGKIRDNILSQKSIELKGEQIIDQIMENIHNFFHARRYIIFNLFNTNREFRNSKNKLVEDLMNKFLSEDDSNNDFAVNAVYSIIHTSNDKLSSELSSLKKEFPDKIDVIDFIVKKKSECYIEYQNDIQKITKKYLSSLMNHLVKTVKLRQELDGIDESISASVQMLKKPTTRKDLRKEAADNYEFFTFFRDPETHYSNDRDLFTPFKVSANTLFEKAFLGKERKDWFQYSNNMKDEYENGTLKVQRDNFWKWYNATANVPIQFHYRNQAQYPNIYGFLSIDCKNINNLDIFSYEKHFHLLSIYADALASYLKTFDELFPDLYIVKNNLEAN